MQQILVVDDEIGIRELLSEILSEEGYQVRLAENASEARAYRSRTRPDLVLLDIWMPDTDGITLLKEWASAGLLTMPVVMMSGHGTIDTAVQATRIGAYDFLEKPIALQKLLATVGRALKHGGEQPQASLSLAALGRAPLIAELKAAARARRQPAHAGAARRRARLRHRALRALAARAQHAVGRARFERAARRSAARAPQPGARRHALPARSRRAEPHRAERPAAAPLQARPLQRAADRAARRASSPSSSRWAASTRGSTRRSRAPRSGCRACASTARTCPRSPTSCSRR